MSNLYILELVVQVYIPASTYKILQRSYLVVFPYIVLYPSLYGFSSIRVALPITSDGINLLHLASGESALIASHDLSRITTEYLVCILEYLPLGRVQTPTPAFSEY